MPRDPRKLRAFTMADDLVPKIYEVTKTFPADERFGLISQMRRAAVSIPTNIVEGCARRKTNDYLHFLNIATGSAYELGYLVELSSRLQMMPKAQADLLADRCGHVAASLSALTEALEAAERSDVPPTGRKPKA